MTLTGVGGKNTSSASQEDGSSSDQGFSIDDGPPEPGKGQCQAAVEDARDAPQAPDTSVIKVHVASDEDVCETPPPRRSLSQVLLDLTSPRAIMMCIARRWPHFLFFAILMGGGVLVAHFFRPQIKSALSWFIEADTSGIPLYTAFSAMAIVCLLPATPMCVAAGYIYGWPGLLIVAVGLSLGAAISFAIVTLGLYCLGLNTLQDKLLAKYPEFKYLRHMISRTPYRALLLARFLYLPSAVMNYGLALIGAPFIPSMISALGISTLFSVPNVYVGVVLKDVDIFAYLDGEATSDADAVAFLPAIIGVVLSCGIGAAFAWKLRAHLIKSAQPPQRPQTAKPPTTMSL